MATTGNNIGNRNGSFYINIHKALIPAEFNYRDYGRNCKEGFVERDTLITRFQNASVYVNFSRTIIPTALLEAMTLGMPVVTIHTYGPPTPSLSGTTVSSLTIQLISSSTLSTCRTTPGFGETLGEHARQTVEGRYSRAEFAIRWTLLLQSIA